MAKEAYRMAKETYYMAKEAYCEQHTGAGGIGAHGRARRRNDRGLQRP